MLVEVYKSVGKSVFGSVKGPKRANRPILWLYEVEETFYFLIDSYLKDNAFTAVKRDVNFSTRYVKGVPFANRRHTKGVPFP